VTDEITIIWRGDDPDTDEYYEADVGPPDNSWWGEVRVSRYEPAADHWFAEIEIPNGLSTAFLVRVPTRGSKSAEDVRAATEKWLASDEAMPTIRSTMARQLTES
jgi:hypothetical protein